MAEYVTLLGAEDVRRAGAEMQRAANDMRNAAGDMQQAVQRQQQVMDDWLARFESVVDRLCEAIKRDEDEDSDETGPILDDEIKF